MPSFSLDRARLWTGIRLTDLLVECGLCPSKREARRLIQQGGVYINGVRA